MRFIGPITYDLRLDGPNVQVIAHVAGHPSEIICGGHFGHQQAREFAQAILELADRAEVAEGLETGSVPRRATTIVLPTQRLFGVADDVQHPEVRYGLDARGKV